MPFTVLQCVNKDIIINIHTIGKHSHIRIITLINYMYKFRVTKTNNHT